MGKQGNSRVSRAPDLVNGRSYFGMKTCQHRGVENEGLVGRRMPGEGGNFSYGGSKVSYGGKRHVRLIGVVLGLMSFLFFFDSLIFSVVRSMVHDGFPRRGSSRSKDDKVYVKAQTKEIVLYGNLVNMASSALVVKEFKRDLSTPWEMPYKVASTWKPCADKDNIMAPGKLTRNNGFILVSANGGLNQQRVAVCNAVAVASLLNATLVLPRFLYSNVWKDPSQFGDIYQEEYFMNHLKDEVHIVKELPSHLLSLNIEAIGSLITDADLVKEAKPIDFIKIALPRLLKNGVVHFLGFGNRLGFDPLPFNLQRLRCKCNFHALTYVPKIQQVGSLLLGSLVCLKLRANYHFDSCSLKQILGNFLGCCAAATPRTDNICRSVSPAELRKLGRCPLTPEEAGLVLSSLGFSRGTYIYLAGSQIYGGKSRMQPFTSLYPNVVTKEDLLTPGELAPFRNFSSQLAALDFIACATADVFAMTDSGSQLSSLVSGYRIYYGGANAPTLRPNKERLAAILSENSTIRWNDFAERVRKMIREGQKVRPRSTGRSIYRLPRSPEFLSFHFVVEILDDST
ncbi:hypothetical protein Syun_008897 [Stephania yunnanensis]|uniref:O-fucosyltransferase family protein n=1 Tax=Stephania yunnanensis TaxID=152371 RepID=A0AAP0KF63_9MAGN